MAISNLLNLGQNSRQLICGFDNAYGAQLQGVIALVYDFQFLKINHFNAANIWQNISSKSGNDTSIQGGGSLSIVYVAISSDNTRRYTYIGKAARDLRTRYSAAGPNSGGMQQCFYNYFENNNNATSMDITIYATGNPCLIEGWCVDMAINKGFTLLNVIDPN
mgnify:CR=1 FL=1